MINLFCDESYDSTTYALAGWIARPEAWDYITPRWAEMLRKHNAPYFHAAEIVGRDLIAGSPFKGWTFDQEVAIFRDATDLILDKKCSGWLSSIGCSISSPSVKACFPLDESKDNSVWYLLFTRFLHMLAVDLPPSADRINLVFDEKKEVKKLVDDYYLDAKKATDEFLPSKFNGSAIAFGSDEQILPLQIADFFAYEWRKRISDKVRNSEKKQRTSYTLLKQRPRFLKHYNSRAIEAIRARATATGNSMIEVMWEYPTTED
jgi:hypothetical protein